MAPAAANRWHCRTQGNAMTNTYCEEQGNESKEGRHHIIYKHKSLKRQKNKLLERLGLKKTSNNGSD